jgi:hypothetical protein
MAQQPTQEQPKAPEFSGKPKDISDKISKDIPSNYQEAFARVIKAGMKVMFSEETHQFMIKELQKEGELSERIGEAVAGLMLLLYMQSNKTMPQEVIIPAGIYLLGQGAQFLEEVTGEEITPDITGAAMQVMIDTLLTKFGIDPARVTQVAEKAAQGGYN